VRGSEILSILGFSALYSAERASQKDFTEVRKAYTEHKNRAHGGRNWSECNECKRLDQKESDIAHQLSLQKREQEEKDKQFIKGMEDRLNTGLAPLREASKKK